MINPRTDIRHRSYETKPSPRRYQVEPPRRPYRETELERHLEICIDLATD